MWKVNERKRERGEEFVSAKNKIVPAKSINHKKDCTKSIYKCTQIITHEEREDFGDYYAVNNEAKKMFIASCCGVCIPDRRRKGKNIDNSKKKKTFKYFLKIKDRKVQMCKTYFLSKRNCDTNITK